MKYPQKVIHHNHLKLSDSLLMPWNYADLEIVFCALYQMITSFGKGLSVLQPWGIMSGGRFRLLRV